MSDSSIRAAGVVVYKSTPRGRRFLLLRNRRHKTWAPPKGHCEPKERLRDCAVRELGEETGIQRPALHPEFRRSTEYSVAENGRTRRKVVTWWLAEVDPALDVRLTDEHDEAAWLSLEEALATLRHDDLRALLIAANRAAESRNDRS